MLTVACGPGSDDPGVSSAVPSPAPPSSEVTPVDWVEVEAIDVEAFNADMEPGKLTLDVGVYFPSNLDPAYDMVTLPRLMESLEAAKEIYAPTEVQIHLLWVKTGELAPRHFAIQSSEIPGVPNGGYVNMYEHSRRNPSVPTQGALDAFGAIVEPMPDAARTVLLVVLQDVFYPFAEVSEGRNWVVKSVRTAGLSWPTYSYVGTLPNEFRGVITLSNLSRPGGRSVRTIAHEIGHKVMNVSHEYRDTPPGHEVYAEDGLMLYGSGEDIPAGAAGRWHVERLRLSPFLYRLAEDGSKQWNPDYQEGGHYYDPIYGDFVVRFEGEPPIPPGW
jgi:hypothetical protein